jgi:hypothetical protein
MTFLVLEDREGKENERSGHTIHQEQSAVGSGQSPKVDSR